MKKYILYTSIIATMLFSCENIENLNANSKAYETTIPEALMSSSQANLADFLADMDQYNNYGKGISQQWTNITYPDADNYKFARYSTSNGIWGTFYVDIIKDLEESKKIISQTITLSITEEKIKNNKIAIIEIQLAHAYQILVDTFGNVPYSEAINNSIITPKYDDAKIIYHDLISRLTNAINLLDTSVGSFGNQDLLYNGNTGNWKKFGNSLKLKLGIHLADLEPVYAKNVIESSVSSGVFVSNTDSALFKFLATNFRNPMEAILSNSTQYVPTSALVLKLNSLNDPRSDKYFNPMSKIGGIYKGANAGQGGSFSNFSHITADFNNPQTKGIILDYSEVEFYLAEAIERGYNVGGTAENHYNNAITASILYWGLSNTDANTYLAQTSVAYPTAIGTWKQKIGNQLWLSLYTRGLEAWVEYRRLDFPTLTPAVGSTLGSIPVRMPYAPSETTSNSSNYQSASIAIGGDLMTTKVFWDIN